MRLEKSRKALELAERHYGLLEDAASDSELFRVEFISGIAMIRRVGSILNDEIRECHPPNSVLDWWKGTNEDVLLKFIKDVRDDEFKAGQDRKTAHHFIHVYDSAGATDSASVGVVASVDLTIKRKDQPDEELSVISSEPEPEAESADISPPEPPSSHRIEWHFAGGVYKDREVLPIVHEYINKISTLIDQAEGRLSN
ncbi:hypothetical protein [Kitasatospora sp. GP82]|uniref:hypothetical protein n=1 Tax=Kitasatospora sp. GP82 TaxID=3035089 RepID=UPI002476288C|nr:hypothetical protein [Kitasatospora sp. GP82]MDH6123431.1 hypothetical protein [Kitasatospora sp. GP82]